jgi:hypothetical protein
MHSKGRAVMSAQPLHKVSAQCTAVQHMRTMPRNHWLSHNIVRCTTDMIGLQCRLYLLYLQAVLQSEVKCVASCNM